MIRHHAHWWLLGVVACALDARNPSTTDVLGGQPSPAPGVGGGADAGQSPPLASPVPVSAAPLAACPMGATCEPPACSGEACCEPACGDCQNCDEASHTCIQTCTCVAGKGSTCYVIHRSQGACGARVLTCTAAGTWPTSEEACTPRLAEVCSPDMVDENCDGSINEGCECNIGTVTTCAELQGAVGECGERALTCTPEGRWQPDVSSCAPQGPELCDAAFLDENCDGSANESPTCEGFVEIDADSTSTCALTESGSAFCWGYNASGQLGDGTTRDSALPRRATQFTGLRGMAAGGDFGCVVLQDGSVQCWGDNAAQQLADGTFTNRLTPAPVEGLDVFSIYAAGGSACAIGSDAVVYCWGLHSPGSRSGFGGGVVAVPLPVGATRVSTGSGSSCAIGTDFRVYCWGSGLANTPPPLGDGVNLPSERPVLVAAISSAVDVNVSQSGACAVLFGGAVQCWGANEWGQMGDGTTTYAPAPVTVPGIQARSVCTGGTHSCAILTDSTLRCWGENSSGQLGVEQPRFTPAFTPVPVVGLPALVRRVSCGFAHTCAILADSTTWCWGANAFGEIGDGIADSQPPRPPTRVHGPPP